MERNKTMKTSVRIFVALFLLWLCTLPANAQVQAPIANAGPDLNVYLGDTATLKGSGSDPNNFPLTYSWAFLSWPGASAPALSAPTSATTTFTPIVEGDYVLQLLVSNGFLSSAPDSAIVVVSVWLAPVASATANPTTGIAPLTVCFDGSASYSPQPTGLPLSFAWSFGDGATDTATGAKPCHIYTTASVNPYVPKLVVTDSRGVLSPADTVAAITVTAANHPPTASPTATPNNGPAPLAVQFAANASDPDGNALTYAWAFGDGGTSTLANPSHTYTSGTYVAWLTVTDSKGASVSKSLVITVNSGLQIKVRFAAVKWTKVNLTGRVTLWADFTPTTPNANDLILVNFDGIQLLAVPFSAFTRDKFTGTYYYVKNGVLVDMDIKRGRLYLITDSGTNLTTMDLSNGAVVGMMIGNAVGVQTINLKQVFPNMLVYMCPGYNGDPDRDWDR